MADTHATAHQCAVCKEGAALLCPNCATGLNAHGQARKVYYCGKVCQAKDWDAGHKLECKVAVDRRQLFRIGSLVQKVFYQSSKSIWFHGVDKVKKIEHPETEDGPRLLVWLSERSDGPDFPAFPDHLIKDKRNERAMLASAASAVIMMSSFMADLVKAAKCHITMEEAGIRSTASQYTRIVLEDGNMSNTASTNRTLIFRATLRNGEVFVLDPRNAMYNFTTMAEHEHGVFQWDSYMERLLVADSTAIDTQPLRGLPPNPLPHGNFADGQAGKFVKADIRATAGMKVFSLLFTLAKGLSGQLAFFLPLQNRPTTFARLLSRSSTDGVHASQVSAFKEQLQAAIRLTRSMVLKDMLMDRLRLKEAN